MDKTYYTEQDYADMVNALIQAGWVEVLEDDDEGYLSTKAVARLFGVTEQAFKDETQFTDTGSTNGEGVVILPDHLTECGIAHAKHLKAKYGTDDIYVILYSLLLEEQEEEQQL